MSQRDLQIQCAPHQNINDIIHRTRKKTPKFHKRPWITKGNLKQKEQSWSIIIPDFKTYYIIVNQNSMVVALKTDTQTSNQNRDPRNKPTHLQWSDSWQSQQRNTFIFNKWCGENRISICTRLKLAPNFLHCTKTNSYTVQKPN
jgi:hypothetical protein